MLAPKAPHFSRPQAWLFPPNTDFPKGQPLAQGHRAQPGGLWSLGNRAKEATRLALLCPLKLTAFLSKTRSPPARKIKLQTKSTRVLTPMHQPSLSRRAGKGATAQRYRVPSLVLTRGSRPTRPAHALLCILQRRKPTRKETESLAQGHSARRATGPNLKSPEPSPLWARQNAPGEARPWVQPSEFNT